MDFWKFTKLAKLVNPRKAIFQQIYEYLWIKLLYRHLHSIPHFKVLDMRNLQYKGGICQKSHNKVTMSVYVRFEFLWNRPYLALSGFRWYKIGFFLTRPRKEMAESDSTPKIHTNFSTNSCSNLTFCHRHSFWLMTSWILPNKDRYQPKQLEWPRPEVTWQHYGL